MAIGYSQPEQLLRDSSICHLKFMLSWQEFLDHGLPRERRSRVDLVGKPSRGDAQRWNVFVHQLNNLGRLSALRCDSWPAFSNPTPDHCHDSDA